MNYKITIKNRENHICNPLLKLADREFETRDEACEAIYGAMYDVIDSESGCEMVTHPRVLMQDFVVCDSEEWCNSAMLFRRDAVPTQREFAKVAGFDNPDDNPNVELPTIDLYDYLCDTDGRTNNLICDEDISELVASFSKYDENCRAYILREGYATEDGVSATVEECD